MAISDAVRLQRDVGLRAVTDGEFRRASWHMDFIYGLDGIERSEERNQVEFHNEGGTITFQPVAPRGHGPHRPGADDLRRGLHGAAGRRGRRGRQAHDPVAQHGPLRQRARPDRRLDLPRARRVLGRPRHGVRRRDPSARRARLHLPAARRHEPRVLQRPRAARVHRADGRRPGAPARALHRDDQPRAGGPAGGHGGHDAPLPRQLPLVVARGGRLRLRRGGAVRRPRGRRLLPRVRRRALRAASSRCASCRRASRSCSAS